MNRALWTYNLLLHAGLGLMGPLVLPPVLARRKWRLTLVDRLGLSLPGRPPSPGRPLWVHALSVGEVLSALPLVAALRRRWPRRPVVFSTTTLTGYRMARERFGSLVDALFFFPYDLPVIVAARLRQVRPAAVIIVETDLWPNFMARAAAVALPVVLVNARLSRRSFAGYRRLRALTMPMFRSLAAVAAQSEADAGRFSALGVTGDRLAVVGNLKFDQTDPGDPTALAAEGRRRLQVRPDQTVLVAGSTHRGDEAALAEACVSWGRRVEDLVCVVVPRDPRRAGEIARAWGRCGLECRLWSRLEGAVRREPVVVVDRMGILGRLYAAADLTFVGGSLAGCGGHNPIEPAALSRPILYGPDMNDFAEIAAQLEDAGAAIRVADGRGLYQAGMGLLGNPEAARRMGASARRVFLAHRGAVERTLTVVTEVLDAPVSRLSPLPDRADLA